jgi:hypothetical protein
MGNHSADIIMAQGNIPGKMPETWIAFDTVTLKNLDSGGGSRHGHVQPESIG